MEEQFTDQRQRVLSWLRLYLIDFTILAMVWGGFYRATLANSDTLIGNISLSATLNARLENYRWLGYVGDGISYLLHYYPYEYQKVSLGLFLVVMAAAMVLLQMTFMPVLGGRLQERHYRTFYIAATSLCYVNVLAAELFYFTESMLIFKFSMLFSMLGCWLFSRRHYVCGSIALLIAPMFYQVSCVQAALVLCTLAILEEQGVFSVKLVRKEIVYIGVPMGSGLLNYVTGPYLMQWISSLLQEDNSVAKSISDATDVLSTGTFSELRSLYESSLGLMIPVYLPLLFSVIVSIAVLFCIWRRPKVLATYLVYKVVTFVLMLVLQLLNDSPEFVPRVMTTFYYMQAMNAVLALQFVELPRLRRGVQGLCVIYVLAQAFFVQIIIANRCLSEYLDRMYANQILDYIQTYEEKSGEEITAIAFREDDHWDKAYDGVYFYKGAINSRVYGHYGYSLVETVARERGLSYEWADVDPAVIEEYFAGHDWDSFDPDEQIVITGNICNVCVF